MGVHTGDCVTVAPQQTLTDRLYQRLRDQAIAVIRAVGVETGGSNVQFAVNPETEEILVIEMNPRVSRSSRARLARRPASRSPRSPRAWPSATRWRRSPTTSRRSRRRASSRRSTTCVVKWPRFAFEKFPGVDPDALHAHEVGGRGDGDRAHVPAGVRQGAALARARHRARRSPRSTPTTLLRDARAPGAPTATTRCSRRFRRGASDRRRPRAHGDRPVVPARAARAGARPRRPVRRRALLQGGRHLRRRVRGAHALLLLGLGAARGARGRARRATRAS